tara:strand:+ start:1035 stop:1187 length:153 start_codon:yes stop_codon:yes gene_type:complete
MNALFSISNEKKSFTICVDERAHIRRNDSEGRKEKKSRKVGDEKEFAKVM